MKDSVMKWGIWNLATIEEEMEGGVSGTGSSLAEKAVWEGT